LGINTIFDFMSNDDVKELKFKNIGAIDIFERWMNTPFFQHNFKEVSHINVMQAINEAYELGKKSINTKDELE